MRGASVRDLFMAVLACTAMSAQNRILVDRVGSTGFIQLEAQSFQKLSPRAQRLAYWLSQA